MDMQNLTVAGSTLLLLAGCSPSGGKHAICIDVASAKMHDTDWQNDLREARKLGKVSLETAIEAQRKRYEKLGSLKYEKQRPEFCDNLDAIRAEVGF
jgi:hypothetical protein